MPFANPGSLVTGGRKFFDKCILGAVEAIVHIVAKAILMTVLTGQYHGAAGSANGIGDIGTIKTHTFSCYPVDGRRLHQLTAISTDGLVSMVVGNNQQNIGSFRRWQIGLGRRFRLR